MLQLKVPGFEILPAKKVLKASEYASLVEAFELIERAKTEAEGIVGSATAAREEEKKRGYEAGLEEGRGEMAESLLSAVTRSVEYFESLEQRVVDIVMQSVQKILGSFDDRELATRVVRNALELFRQQKQVTLRVPPSERNAMQERVGEIMRDFPQMQAINVVGDARIQPGGCILDTDIGVVDCSVETQLAALRRAYTSALKG
jgi:type III secretion protein L